MEGPSVGRHEEALNGTLLQSQGKCLAREAGSAGDVGKVAWHGWSSCLKVVKKDACRRSGLEDQRASRKEWGRQGSNWGRRNGIGRDNPWLAVRGGRGGAPEGGVGTVGTGPGV